MKIFNTQVRMFAVIETDIGEFRVWPSGAVSKLDEQTNEWEPSVLNDELKAKLKQAAQRGFANSMGE